MKEPVFTAWVMWKRGAGPLIGWLCETLVGRQLCQAAFEAGYVAGRETEAQMLRRLGYETEGGER